MSMLKDFEKAREWIFEEHSKAFKRYKFGSPLNKRQRKAQIAIAALAQAEDAIAEFLSKWIKK